MRRLSRYLLGLFWAEAMALFAVAAFLLFLIQCLRLFDALAEKGQSLLTLLGQALLGMPALGTGFLYVCLGIGLGRALRNLQASSELQIIHVSHLLPAMLRAIALYIAIGAGALLLLAHVINPLTQRSMDQWGASIAADLVSRSMIPHKIVEVSSGVSITIGARDAEGNITGFFADDHRDPDARRTYFAKSAIITRDAKGFVLRMEDGAIQQMNGDTHMSEVSFGRYDLALDQLTGAQAAAASGDEQDSVALISSALTAANWTPEIIGTLSKRCAEALRAIAICLLVTGLSAFPTGERRPVEVPIELTVLGAALLERGLGSYLPWPDFAGPAPGAALLILAAILLLAVRFNAIRPIPRRAIA